MSIVQNDTSPIGLYVTLSASNLPATGKTLTITVSKNGAAFAAGLGTVAECTGTAFAGWYNYTPTSAEVGTLGELRILATASGCWDTPYVDRVVQAGASATTQTTMAATVATNLDATISGVPAAVRSNFATELGRIDAAISTRALASGATLTSGERTAIATAMLAAVIETNGATTLSVKQSLQLLAALTGGKISGIVAGTGPQTFTVRSATDLQTIATVTGDDQGNRTAIVLTIP